MLQQITKKILNHLARQRPDIEICQQGHALYPFLGSWLFGCTSDINSAPPPCKLILKGQCHSASCHATWHVHNQGPHFSPCSSQLPANTYPPQQKAQTRTICHDIMPYSNMMKWFYACTKKEERSRWDRAWEGDENHAGMIYWTSIIYLPMTEHMEQKAISRASHRKWRSRYDKRLARSRRLQGKQQLTFTWHTHARTRPQCKYGCVQSHNCPAVCTINLRELYRQKATVEDARQKSRSSP